MQDPFNFSENSEEVREKEPLSGKLSVKLSVPQVSIDFIERHNLLKLFHSSLSSKMVLVYAPAGYGKTTFLSQALSTFDHPVAWISLDENDNKTGEFWSNIIKSLQNVKPGIGESVLASIKKGKFDLRSAIKELADGISGILPDVIIVLDNYHHITLRTLNDSIAFFADLLPPQAHIIISSRTYPFIYSKRLSGQSNLSKIKTVDLRLTVDETRVFFNDFLNLDISEKDLKYLYDISEGWLLGLTVIGDTIKEYFENLNPVDAFTVAMREISEYFTEEVLNQQEQYIRQFLFDTCVLDQFNAHLCDAITGRNDCWQILEKVIHCRLFIHPIGNGWFRYQHVFRRYLYEYLRMTNPDMLHDLHIRASNWFESQGTFENAINHALAAEEYDRAAKLIEHVSFSMLGQDKCITLKNWINQLPREILNSNIYLNIIGVIICDYTRNLENLGEYIRRTQTLGKSLKASAKTNELPANNATLRGFLTAIKSTQAYYEGYIDKTITLSRQELSNLPSDEKLAQSYLNRIMGLSFWVKGELATSYSYWQEYIRLSRILEHPYETFMAIIALAHIQFARGHLHGASETCREVIHLTLANDGQDSLASCYSRMLLAEILYQWNYLDEAQENIVKALDFADAMQESNIYLNGHVALARINIAQGKTDEALNIFRRGNMGFKSPAAQRPVIDMFMTRLWLMLDNAAAASDYIDSWATPLLSYKNKSNKNELPAAFIQKGLFETDIRDIWTELPLLTLVRSNLACGKLDGMFTLLERLRKETEAKQYTFRLIEILILEALILQADGKLTDALQTVEKALAMAETENYLRIFVDEGKPMFRLLSKAISKGIYTHYVSKLLTLFNKSVTSSDSGEMLYIKDDISSRGLSTLEYIFQTLTSREVEILKLVIDGKSNKEIAANLSISLSTVKNHIHRIFRKLDVNTRSQAVIKAKDYISVS